MGRATKGADLRGANLMISIHALRGEGDNPVCLSRIRKTISIHALRGEGDLHQSAKRKCHALFQSTPSVGRATKGADLRGANLMISIHALRGEGDNADKATTGTRIDFNPRPPWGGRRRLLCCRSFILNISIHALRGEGDYR